MAEVQTTTQSGELTQRFIEFVMMQAQNAALFLGQIPNPQTGKAEVNLEVARMFIDQLAMIQEKTRGNLTSEESTVLRNALSSLQMAFVGPRNPLPLPEQPPVLLKLRPGSLQPQLTNSPLRRLTPLQLLRRNRNRRKNSANPTALRRTWKAQWVALRTTRSSPSHVECSTSRQPHRSEA